MLFDVLRNNDLQKNENSAFFGGQIFYTRGNFMSFLKYV